jgi:hypothetical protein
MLANVGDIHPQQFITAFFLEIKSIWLCFGQKTPEVANFRQRFPKLDPVWSVCGPCGEFMLATKYGIGHKSQRKRLRP